MFGRTCGCGQNDFRLYLDGRHEIASPSNLWGHVRRSWCYSRPVNELALLKRYLPRRPHLLCAPVCQYTPDSSLDDPVHLCRCCFYLTSNAGRPPTTPIYTTVEPHPAITKAPGHTPPNHKQLNTHGYSCDIAMYEDASYLWSPGKRSPYNGTDDRWNSADCAEMRSSAVFQWEKELMTRPPRGCIMRTISLPPYPVGYGMAMAADLRVISCGLGSISKATVASCSRANAV